LNYVCWIHTHTNSTTPKWHAETLLNWIIPFQLKKQNIYRSGIDNLGLCCPISGHCSGWKNKLMVFRPQNCISTHCFFLFKTHRKYHKQLDKSIRGLKYSKNHSKTRNQLYKRLLFTTKVNKCFFFICGAFDLITKIICLKS